MSRVRQALPYIFLAPAIAISGYLLFRTLALTSRADIGLGICSVWLGVDCDATLTADFAWPLGVPIAGWGIVYFVMIGAAVALGRALGEPLEHVSLAAALLVGVAGLAASAWLSGMMILGVVRICPLCFTVHALNLCLVVGLLASRGDSLGSLPALFSRAARTVFSSSDENAQSKWALLGMACVALITLVVYQWILVQADRAQAASQSTFSDIHGGNMEQVFVHGLPVKIPIDESDPQLGPEDAPVQIVVFSSFQCPACVQVAPILVHAAEHFGDSVRLTYKHYPLGAACNPALEGYDMHPRACDSAYAAQAALAQGEFWAYHDGVHALGHEPSDNDLAALAASLDLDVTAFNALRQSDTVQAMIAEDVQHGRTLNLEGTPTVFINGRELLGVDRDILHNVIENLIADDGHLGHIHD